MTLKEAYLELIKKGQQAHMIRRKEWDEYIGLNGLTRFVVCGSKFVIVGGINGVMVDTDDAKFDDWEVVAEREKKCQ